MNSDQPDSELLRALGALTWETIWLESLASSMSEHVLGDWIRRKTPIGTYVSNAVKRLGRGISSPEVDRAIKWLENAAQQLERRNQVLHSIPMESPFWNEDATLAGSSDVLVHFPNKGGGWIALELETSTFNGIAEDMHALARDWRPVMRSLFGDDNNWPFGQPWPVL
jgi:hypothetical protein